MRLVRSLKKYKLTKRKALFLSGTGLFCLLLRAIPVFAAGKDLTDIYKVGTYNINTFQSYMVDADFSLMNVIFGDTGVSVFKFFSTSGFGLSKLLWQVYDSMIEKLYKGAEMDKLIHTFFAFSQNIYSQLFNVFGLTLIGIYVIYVFYLKMFKTPQRATSAFLKMVLVVGFSVVWFGHGNVSSQGEKFTKNLDSWSTSVEGLVFQATNGIDDLQVASNSDDAIKQIRNMYYQKAVVDPYLLLNYGTTNLQEIQNAGISPTEFLTKKYTDKDKEYINKKLEKAKDDDENENYRQYIKPEMGQYKAIVGGLTPLLNISIGTPILVIGIVRFIFQLGAILMLVAIPFLLILSFFPALDYLIFKGFRTFVGFMLQKSIYSVLILVAFLVFNVVDTLIPLGTDVMFIVNIFIKALISLIAFFKRKAILEKLGLGQAEATLNQVKKGAQQAKQETKEHVRSGIDRGQRGILKGAAVAGKVNIGARSAMGAMQTLNQVRQQRKNTAEKMAPNGRVINPVELGTRNPQKLPFSGKKVIYGEHDKKEESKLRKDNGTELQGVKSPVGLSGLNGVKGRTAQTLSQSAHSPVTELRPLKLNRNPINYSGQKIPLINRTVPHLKINSAFVPPKGENQPLKNKKLIVSRTPVDRTGQKISLTSPNIPHLILEKKMDVNSSQAQVEQVTNMQRKEAVPIIQETGIKQKRLNKLPKGRTPQRKVGSYYEK